MLFLLAPLVLAVSLVQADSSQWDARISQMRGEATLFTASDPQGVPAEKDVPLEAGDRIRTGANAGVEISLDGDSVVELGADTDYTLESARRSDASFSLSLGYFLAKIRGLGAGSLRVRTPTAVAAVRGTEFAVEVSPDAQRETYVGVFDEGKVEVSAAGGSGPAEMLISNQETRVTGGAAPAPPYQLKRLMRHRERVRGMRKRLAAMGKVWKALPSEKRREARGRLFDRMRERRRLREQQERRPRTQKPQRRKSQSNQEEMEKRREAIRRRIRQ